MCPTVKTSGLPPGKVLKGKFPVTKEKFLVLDSQVRWSDVILILSSLQVWIPFIPSVVYTERHTFEGLQGWMKKNEQTGWQPELLKPSSSHEQIFVYGVSQFWIPFDIPNPEVVCHRACYEYGHKTAWLPFRQGVDLVLRSMEELHKWMDTNACWNKQNLKQMSGYDQRVFIYGKADNHDEFWVPANKTGTPDALLGPYSLPPEVTCVNPLGCYLTKGKSYQVQGQEEDLLLVIDDSGERRAFLPERFTR